MTTGYRSPSPVKTSFMAIDFFVFWVSLNRISGGFSPFNSTAAAAARPLQESVVWDGIKKEVLETSLVTVEDLSAHDVAEVVSVFGIKSSRFSFGSGYEPNFIKLISVCARRTNQCLHILFHHFSPRAACNVFSDYKVSSTLQIHLFYLLFKTYLTGPLGGPPCTAWRRLLGRNNLLST